MSWKKFKTPDSGRFELNLRDRDAYPARATERGSSPAAGANKESPRRRFFGRTKNRRFKLYSL
ncbi:hypothetical protein AMJ49_02100 [Parcubacteria bacterium DG_74_2]|nr:MAG: hypothetical protein AMJ49_02100 [Parcubacteria bacterium DG_74_2]